MTSEMIESLPVGRVIERKLTPLGSHIRVKIVRPLHLNKCFACGCKIKGNAVKTEKNCGKALYVHCPECYVNTKDA